VSDNCCPQVGRCCQPFLLCNSCCLGFPAKVLPATSVQASWELPPQLESVQGFKLFHQKLPVTLLLAGSVISFLYTDLGEALNILLIYLFILRTVYVAQAGLKTWVQAILLHQPPKWQGLKACHSARHPYTFLYDPRPPFCVISSPGTELPGPEGPVPFTFPCSLHTQQPYMKSSSRRSMAMGREQQCLLGLFAWCAPSHSW
jgi:hypothetical protein